MITNIFTHNLAETQKDLSKKQAMIQALLNQEVTFVFREHQEVCVYGNSHFEGDVSLAYNEEEQLFSMIIEAYGFIFTIQTPCSSSELLMLLNGKEVTDIYNFHNLFDDVMTYFASRPHLSEQEALHSLEQKLTNHGVSHWEMTSLEE